MEIKFKVEYERGDIVYLITDLDDNKCIVVGYVIDLSNSVKYVLKCKDYESDHFAEELSAQSSNLRGEN